MRAHLSVILVLLAPGRALAAPSSDGWLPGSGKLGAVVATGVPFLVMSELAVGVTDHAALGVLGGTTPSVSGFGLRPRGAIPCGEHVRLLLSVPVVYYPQRSDGPGWWLARPSALLSWTPSDSWAVSGGAGAVGIATQAAILGGQDDANKSSPYGAQFRNRRTDLWWTLNTLASFAVTEKTQVFSDVTLVLRDYGFAGSEWIGVAPFIAFLGVSTNL